MSDVREIIATGDNIRIVDPGITIVDAWTAGIRVLPFDVYPNVFLKIGPNNNSSNARGVVVHSVDIHEEIAYNGGPYSAVALPIVDEYNNIAVGRSNAGISTNNWYVNGVSGATGSDDPFNELAAGDVFALGLGYGTTPFFDSPQNRYAFAFFLQGIWLTESELDDYFADPCQLLADYGPDGLIEPDALKVFLLGDMSIDLAQGNTVAVTGTTVEDDAVDYVTSCGVVSTASLYLLAAKQGATNYGKAQLAGSAPATDVTATGARVEGLAAGKYARMQHGAMVDAADFGDTAEPSGEPDPDLGDAWVTDPISGTFAADDFTIGIPLIASVGEGAGVRARVRVWKSADGIAFDEITSAVLVCSSVTDLQDDVAQISTGTVALPEIVLDGERLYFQVAFETV